MALLVAGALVSRAAADTVVANLGADFRPTTPKAGWAYLQSTAATGGTETALTYGAVVGNAGNIGYGGGANTFNLGAVLGTNTGANAFKMFSDGQFNAGVLGTDLLVHPGDPVALNGGGRPYVILRYTLSPADVTQGNFATIAGSFRELIPGGDSIDAFVFRNGTPLFQVSAAADTLPQASGTFQVQTLVAAGDTISFVVGIKANLGGDETAVRGTIALGFDTTPPAVAGPPVQVDANRLTLTFTEPVQLVPAQLALDGGASILALAPGAAANSFDLTTTPLVGGRTYTLSLTSVLDLSGNPLTTQVVFAALDFSPNLIAALRPPAEPIGPGTRRGPFVFSEVHYHPPGESPSNHLEFIEIHNSQPWPEVIGGHRITGEIDYTIPAGTTIPAGGYLVIAGWPAAVMEHYSIGGVIGGFTNRLNNAGGTLRLRNELGAVVFEVDYDTQPPWPAAADGAGHSLVLARPTFGMNDPRAWAASRNPGGSPGSSEPSGPAPLPVVINEFLANGDAEPDFIELFNLSSQPVPLDGCSLSDDAGTNKFVLPPGTVLAPRGLLVFNEAQLGFSLSAGGETAWLRDRDGRVLDAVRYGGQQRGVSTGRTPDGAPLLSRLAARTPGAANAPAMVSAVVLNEIAYAPPGGNDDEEFVELLNASAAPVDISGWRLRGGIRHTLPAGTTLAPGGLLVLAANPARLLAANPGLSPSAVLGGYEGRLANSGERVALEAVQTDGTNTLHYVVDEVTYGTGGRWGRWSDGGGSSLERIDPAADPRLPTSWADSDSATNSPWTTVEFTGTIDNGQGTPDRLQILLQGAGECLVDDIEVLQSGVAGNRVANAGFEAGTNGWSFQGTHRLSTVDDAGGVTGPRCLHLRATGRGDTGPNKVQAALTSAFTAGQTATIRARVRWLAGHPEILLRLRGSWLEAFGSARATARCGTPGRPNSRALPNAGPAITGVSHVPALPAALAPVTIYARVADPHGLGFVRLHYRLDPSPAITVVDMEHVGAGVYAGRIPGQPAGTLAAFYLTAGDAAPGTPATSQFPTDAPAREALVRWGETQPAGAVGTYRLWFTQATRTRWETREPQSNEPLDATFVSGDSRVIYNAGVMYSGSPFHTPLNTGPLGVPCDYQVELPPDDPMLGETDLILSPPGSPWGTDLSILDYTMIREQIIWWIARQLGVPSIHRRFVRVVVNGQARTTIFEDTQQPAGEFVREWFPDRSGGDLHKAQDWIEFPDTGNSFLSDVRASLERFVTTGGTLPPKRYRWIWAPRAVEGSVNDFTNLFTLVDTMALPDTNVFTAQVSSLVDVEGWFRAFAVQRIAGNWDTWGWTFGKNMYAYKPPGEPWALIPWDIDFSFGLNSSATDADVMINGNGGTQPGDPVTTRLRTQPALQRAYWRAFEDAVNGPMEDGRVAARIDTLQAGLVANGFAPASAAGVKSWISARRTYLRGQLASRTNAPLAITLNSGLDFTTNGGVVRLTGSAPVGAATLLLNGAALPVLWTGVTTWSMVVPLEPGTNTLVLTALDSRGQPSAIPADTITIVSTATPPVPDGQVVINEIHYNPIAPDAAFVEIFNPTTNTFRLDGWSLDGAGFTFPAGTILTNGQFYVLAKDRGALANSLGAGALANAEFNGTLANGGEVLSLLRPRGTNAPAVVDRVRYEPDAPWPAAANGSGASLQLVDPAADHARVSNWSDGSGWRFFSFTGPISTSRLSIFLDALGGDVYLDDLALVPGSIAGAGPSSIVNGGFEQGLGPAWIATGLATNSHVTNSPVRSGARSLHYLQSPGNAGLTTFYQDVNPPVVTNAVYTLSGWYQVGSGAATSLTFRAGTTFQSRPSLRPAGPTPGAPNFGAASLPPFPPLWLNEVAPENPTGPADAAGEREPWVELYNAGSQPVSLDGLFLSDSYTDLARWAFPAGTVVPAGGFLVVWCDGETAEGSTAAPHAGFRPAPGEGRIALSRMLDGSPQILDYLNYRQVPAGASHGSVPDGQPFYRGRMHYPTPGAPNDGRSAPIAVRINEWVAANSGPAGLADPADGNFEDWFELYNPGPDAVDLGGWYLSDNPASPFQFAIPANGHYRIPAGGFLLVWADGEPGQNSTNRADLHVSFSLRAAGEAIGLFAPDGSVVDLVTFTNQAENVSLGRSPDGGPSIVTLASPSPRSSNGGTGTIAPLLGPATAPSAGTIAFTIATQAGRTYQVEYTDQLGGGPWLPLGSPRVASGSTLTITDATTASAQRFYRVVTP